MSRENASRILPYTHRLPPIQAFKPESTIAQKRLNSAANPDVYRTTHLPGLQKTEVAK
jgi:hypothetical protein